MFRRFRFSLQALGISALLALSGLPAVGGELAVAGSRVQLVEVNAPTAVMRSRLARLGLDLTEHGTADGVQVILYGPEDAELLRSAGYTWDVVVPDLIAASRARAEADARYAARVDRSPLPSGRTAYRTLDDYEADMRALAKENPDLVRLFELPHETVEGRTVLGIEVASGVKAEDGRPLLALMGLHHAREWPSGEHTIEFAFDLVNNYGKDPRITRLVDQVRTIFVPVVNPDGFNYSRTLLPTEYKRKNCRVLDGQSLPAPACGLSPAYVGAEPHVGVDLNRNYGAFWGGSGSSDMHVTQNYRGPAPFSEPESQNIRDLIAAHQVVVLITNHTSGQLVLRPPGTAAMRVSPEERVLKALGDRMASRNGYTSQHGWELYDTTGTTEDWSYWATGGLGYTFEMMTAFHPTFGTVANEYGAGTVGNRGAFLVALEAAADPALHSVITGRAPRGAVLRITKDVETPTSQEMVIEDRLESTMVVTRGRFVWHVNPSTPPTDLDPDVAVGEEEVWRLTCERPDGKVLQTVIVEVLRGQSETVNLATCVRKF